MDTMIGIKEETPYEVTSQTERESFLQDVTMKWNSDATDELETKIQIKEEIPVSDFGSQNKKQFFSEDLAIKAKQCNKDCEMDTKIKIEEELWWLETPCVRGTKVSVDESIASAESKRFHAGIAPRCKSVIFPDEDSGKGVSFHAKMDSPQYEAARNCKSKESDVQEISSGEKMVYLGGKMDNTSSRMKKVSLIHQNSTQEHEIYKNDSYKSILDRNELKCDICKKRFTTSSHLERHILVHQNKKPHKCDLCEQSFAVLSCLKAHKLIHKGKMLHKCDACGKCFTLLSNLKKHKLIHKRKKPPKCDICGKEFSQLSNLKRHKLIHEGIKLCKCDACGKGFSSLADLNRHKLSHEGIKPHVCDTCGNGFSQLSSLKAHKLIHEGKKPHKCDICDKCFTQSSSLIMHKLIHEGKKPHKCDACGICFIRMCNLKKHKFIHEGKRPHKCDVCGKSYTHLSYLKRHKLTHEGEKPHM